MSKVIKRQQSTESVPGMGGRNKMQSEGVRKRKITEKAFIDKKGKEVFQYRTVFMKDSYGQQF